MSTELTEAELRKIEKRAKAARPGPWKIGVEGTHYTGEPRIVMVEEGASSEDKICLIGLTNADHDFIAAARLDVMRLVAEVRRLRRLLEDQNV
ncbi:MAG TPA: hypothetical protein VFS21_24200 [Roseiflexaceae bacterium]|nr:hypothetical protein [Roseiflexaceae bacterium]